MSVMALPLVLPVILLLIKITAVSMALMVDTSVGGDILILAAIDLMICGLMLLLFPIIWRS
jgi:heme exporter protein B